MTDKVQCASEKDIDQAVAAAKLAFPKWKKTPSGERMKIMLKFADLVEQHIDKIAELESVCMGQPIMIAKKLVEMQVAQWRYYSGFCDKIAGQTFPENGDGYFKMVNYEPLGVCAGISAWNATQFFVVGTPRTHTMMIFSRAANMTRGFSITLFRILLAFAAVAHSF